MLSAIRDTCHLFNKPGGDDRCTKKTVVFPLQNSELCIKQPVKKCITEFWCASVLQVEITIQLHFWSCSLTTLTFFFRSEPAISVILAIAAGRMESLLINQSGWMIYCFLNFILFSRTFLSDKLAQRTFFFKNGIRKIAF